MYRTGKSYLLNRMLLNQSRGFDVGPTINACTKVSQLSLHRLALPPCLDRLPSAELVTLNLLSVVEIYSYLGSLDLGQTNRWFYARRRAYQSTCS